MFTLSLLSTLQPLNQRQISAPNLLIAPELLIQHTS